MQGIQEQRRDRWWSRTVLVTSAYRIVAFTIGMTLILAQPSDYPSIILPIILLCGFGSYILVSAFYAFRWYADTFAFSVMLVFDIAVGAFLLICTGGLQSPFLLCTLAPVVMAAIFLEIKTAASIVAVSVVYIIVSQLLNPFFPNQHLSSTGLFYIVAYIIAAFLIATLPSLINVNVRQRLHYNNILQERQRLSREIHDGEVQTISALRWQVQLLSRRLAEKGINLNEIRELEKLAEKAQQETRESLELLRNYTGDGSFLPHLKDYLEHLNRKTNINFRLDAGIERFHLGAIAELELLRICQEALTNIRKHADARNVWVNIKSTHKHLEVSITDDGRGFDILSLYRNGSRYESHGLAVMSERAQSIGGRLRVLTLPGKGMEVRIEAPMNGNRSR